MTRAVRRIPIPLPNTGAMLRRRNALFFRTLLIGILVGFALLQVYLLNSSTASDFNSASHSMALGGSSADTAMGGSGGALSNDSAAAILKMVPAVLHKYLTPPSARPRHNQSRDGNGTDAAVGGAGGVTVELTIDEMKRSILRYNEQQTILNEDIFGPLQNDSVIIVVQVHRRISYLRHLIVSLAQARGISRSLLIFSHDFYDEEINELVQSIDFCKVMQIFYPHSIQTHPNEFPGADPNDCPRDMKKEQATIKQCNSFQSPDLYGHYREPKFTQTKHHWWWKANRVFDELEVTRYHTGLVVFLEEDHYVAEDFLYLLTLMQQKALTMCPKCNILSLGTYLKIFTFHPNVLNKVDVLPWVSSKHNMGMVFNKTTWRHIVNCAPHFCSYDDYNWDWSLQHVSQQCLKQKLHAMVSKGPRVFHIGECGVHHKKKNCESNQVISRVQKVLQTTKKRGQMFPKTVTLIFTNKLLNAIKLRKGNGGWGDKRDHQLCLNMTLGGRA